MPRKKPEPQPVRVFNVLNLGAGVQSSRILLGACRGDFPKFDAVVFADTQWEPKGVYENLKFLSAEAEKAGMTVSVRTRGNLRVDGIDFRRLRKSVDGKRHASIPLFVKNADGSQGRIRRQCTKEYKIEVVEEFIRRELLGLAKRKRVKGVLVRQWFGISCDETRRAAYPGIYKSKKVKVGVDLLDEPILQTAKVWRPAEWKENVYPLLNAVYTSDRTFREEKMVAGSLHNGETREDVIAWLEREYPGRTFPRSACLGRPFRSNAEWLDMKENAPDEWEDACDFDEQIRLADKASATTRHKLVGEPYVHRQLVPLRMADLHYGVGVASSGGCGVLRDGQDGLCNT